MEPANGLLCRNMLFSLLDVLLGSFVSLILYAFFAFVPGYCVTVFQLLWPQTSVQNLTSVCSTSTEGFCGNESGSVIT